MVYARINFTAGQSVPTGEFPGRPANFVMRMSGRPADFCDFHKLLIGNLGDFRKDPSHGLQARQVLVS